FDDLDAPVIVVGSRNQVTPAPELEKLFFPQVDTLLDAIHERVMPLAGRVPVADESATEMLRRAKFGV
ncbi:MAG: hypothetical protein LBV00_08175, partial [Propionibacteriaceae bacterium]|nr:hypothetical protein [Propionibacteriaceae bacterium]